MVKDGIGQELHIGDDVVYVLLCSSSVTMRRKHITSFTVSGDKVLLNGSTDGRTAKAPHNLIRLTTHGDCT